MEDDAQVQREAKIIKRDHETDGKTGGSIESPSQGLNAEFTSQVNTYLNCKASLTSLKCPQRAFLKD